MNQEGKEKLKKDCGSLLDDIITRAHEEDEAHKVAAIRAGKGSQAVGESWMVFHLKVLKEHLNEAL